MSSSAPMPLKTRIAMIVAGLVALAFMGTPIVNMMSQGSQKNQQQARSEKFEQLKAQETGFEKVLEREPKNENALKGLVQTRLEMQDYEGAIDPLEKLVELNPEKESYQSLLAKLKHQTSQSK